MLDLRKPTVSDVPLMHALMQPHVRSEALLPRSTLAIAEHLRDYTVAEKDGKIVGLISVTLVDLHLAEVGAVVCEHPEHLERLIGVALDEAARLGVSRVFLLAPDAAPYEPMGFRRATLDEIPEKRDRQCLRCSRLPRCRQVPLVKEL